MDGKFGDGNSHAQLVFPENDHVTAGVSESGKPVVLSPMPGKVIKVGAREGEAVKQGTMLVVLEAMKMEHVVNAPCDGYVYECLRV